VGEQGIHLNDNLLDLLNSDDMKDLKEQIVNTNNKIKDKENTIKKLSEKLEESENFVRTLEEKFKSQIKNYEEMVGDSKEKDTLKEQVDLLKNQVKIKDETLWEIKNL